VSRRRAVVADEPDAPRVERVDAAGRPGVSTVWRLRSLEAARQVLRARHATTQAGFTAEAIPQGYLEHHPILVSDGPQHDEQRRKVARFLAPTVVADRYTDLMHDTADRLLAQAVADGGCTLDELALLYTVEVTAEVVGLTESSVPRMARRLEAMFSQPPFDVTRRDLGRTRRQWMQAAVNGLVPVGRLFLADVRPAVRARRREPRDDIVSHLLAEGYSTASILVECVTYGTAGMVTTREFVVMAALHLLDGAGTLRELPVPRQPIAGPALGSDGSIILVDRAAVAWALDRAGQTRWRGAAADRGEATSGPVVAGDGSILFTTVDRVQALAADGTARWSSDVLDGPSELLPRVVPDGALVLLQDRIIRLADGRALPQQFVEPAGEFRDPLLLVGADGSLARRVADQVEIWQLHDGAPVVVARRSWPSASATITFPTQAGISRGGIAWLLYGAGAGEARLVWLAADGSSAQQATGMRAAQVIAVAPDGAVLVCGQQRGAAACAVLERTGTRWREVLGVPGGVVGGAFAGARAVVLTDAGGLVVIEFAAAGP